MPDDLAHRTNRKLSPGWHYPLGATPGLGGVNFSLYSATAEEVWLLLFDRPDGDPTDVIRVEDRDRFAWHVFVHGAGAGQLYGYKVRGPFDPARGLRFNDRKLLIDPYAKALTGKIVNEDNLLLAYDPGDPARDLSLDRRENQAVVPKAIVVDDRFDWQGDAPPSIPFERMVIYETHLKGFTAHPSSKVTHPGTYLGFIEKIPHLQSLGVNAVELLPVQEFYVEDFLRAKGLTNYWGYNTAGFFAPEVVLRHRPPPGLPGGGVQDAGAGAAPRGDRGDPRRGVQPHGGGERAGPHLLLQGDRQPVVLRADRGPRRSGALLHELDGLRQHLQPVDPPRDPAGDGFAAVLGRGDARRRVPVRSRLRARARGRDVPEVRLLLRRRLPGSGAAEGQAHRRTVGPRVVRGRELPRGLVGVERPVPRHGAPFREGGRRAASGPRVPADGVGRPVRRRRALRLQQRQLRHLPRRVHPARPGLVQREAQRGEPRGEPGRHGRQQLLELRRGRGDGRPGDRAPAAAAGEEPRLPAALLLRDPDDPRRRRIPPDAGREQQRLLPGQPDLLVRLGGGRAERGHGRLLPEGDRAHEEVHDPPAAQVLHRHGHGPGRERDPRHPVVRRGPRPSPLGRSGGAAAVLPPRRDARSRRRRGRTSSSSS